MVEIVELGCWAAPFSSGDKDYAPGMPEGSGTGADERLRQIEAVTDAELAHLGADDLLAELLERVRELLAVDTVMVLVLDASGRQLVPLAALGLEEEVRRGGAVPVGKGFAGAILAERQPRVLDRVDSTTVLSPVLWQHRLASMLGVPVLSGGTPVGVLHVGTSTSRQFVDEDIKLLQLVADRVALAVQSRSIRSERAAGRALQGSLLPAELPSVPGVELAARYVAGVGEVGGDWYDVFPLPSGRLGIVIGDVAGRGLRAAVVMGRLRSALRAYALETEDPAEVLTRLDRKAQYFEPTIMATVLYAVADPAERRIRISSAGHPPPVLAVPGEPARVLELAGDLPLGVRLEHPRGATVVDLPPGAVACLYTDGLVERRGHGLDEGIERLRVAVATGPAEAVCAAVMGALVDPEVDDDIALVVLRHIEGEPEYGA